MLMLDPPQDVTTTRMRYRGHGTGTVPEFRNGHELGGVTNDAWKRRPARRSWSSAISRTVLDMQDAVRTLT